MKTKTTLSTAILTFANTGVFGPHGARSGYEPPRAVSSAERIFIRPKPTAH